MSNVLRLITRSTPDKQDNTVSRSSKLTITTLSNMEYSYTIPLVDSEDPESPWKEFLAWFESESIAGYTIHALYGTTGFTRYGIQNYSIDIVDKET